MLLELGIKGLATKPLMKELIKLKKGSFVRGGWLELEFNRIPWPGIFYVVCTFETVKNGC